MLNAEGAMRLWRKHEQRANQKRALVEGWAATAAHRRRSAPAAPVMASGEQRHLADEGRRARGSIVSGSAPDRHGYLVLQKMEQSFISHNSTARPSTQPWPQETVPPTIGC